MCILATSNAIDQLEQVESSCTSARLSQNSSLPLTNGNGKTHFDIDLDENSRQRV